MALLSEIPYFCLRQKRKCLGPFNKLVWVRGTFTLLAESPRYVFLMTNEIRILEYYEHGHYAL